MRALNIAATGMQSQQLMVDVIANNIANINTTGFKRQRAEFEDLLYQDMKRAGTNSSDAGTIVPAGIQIGLGVSPGSTYRINEQGEFSQTENIFDLAIEGKGYFQVELPDGSSGYTRTGTFSTNADGELVTQQGYTVSPGITIPEDAVDITINDSGEVLVSLQGEETPQNVGQIDIATFQNTAGLVAQGNNILTASEGSGPVILGTAGIDGVGTILQGYVETSNVDPVTEITNLINAQRGYEMNSKIISAGDEMLQTLNQAT